MWIEPRGFDETHARGNTEAHRLQDPDKWVPFGVGAIEGRSRPSLRVIDDGRGRGSTTSTAQRTDTNAGSSSPASLASDGASAELPAPIGRHGPGEEPRPRDGRADRVGPRRARSEPADRPPRPRADRGAGRPLARPLVRSSGLHRGVELGVVRLARRAAAPSALIEVRGDDRGARRQGDLDVRGDPGARSGARSASATRACRRAGPSRPTGRTPRGPSRSRTSSRRRSSPGPRPAAPRRRSPTRSPIRGSRGPPAACPSSSRSAGPDAGSSCPGRRDPGRRSRPSGMRWRRRSASSTKPPGLSRRSRTRLVAPALSAAATAALRSSVGALAELLDPDDGGLRARDERPADGRHAHVGPHDRHVEGVLARSADLEGHRRARRRRGCCRRPGRGSGRRPTSRRPGGPCRPPGGRPSRPGDPGTTDWMTKAEPTCDMRAPIPVIEPGQVLVRRGRPGPASGTGCGRCRRRVDHAARSRRRSAWSGRAPTGRRSAGGGRPRPPRTS